MFYLIFAGVLMLGAVVAQAAVISHLGGFAFATVLAVLLGAYGLYGAIAVPLIRRKIRKNAEVANP